MMPLHQAAQVIATQHRPRSWLVPTLIIHGTDDQTVNPINAAQIVEQTRLVIESLYPDREAPTLREEHWIESGGRRYRQQDMLLGQKILLRSILIDDLGHAWSGGDPHLKFFDPVGPDASRLILEFLLPHRLSSEPTAGDETIRSTTAPHIAPLPSP